MSGWVGNVHIYREPGQPFVEYLDRNIDPPMKFRNPPYSLAYCHTCGRLRAAKDLNVHVYYDHVATVCAQTELARSPEFPFAVQRVCAGYTFEAVHGH